MCGKAREEGRGAVVAVAVAVAGRVQQRCVLGRTDASVGLLNVICWALVVDVHAAAFGDPSQGLYVTWRMCCETLGHCWSLCCCLRLCQWAAGYLPTAWDASVCWMDMLQSDQFRNRKTAVLAHNLVDRQS